MHDQSVAQDVDHFIEHGFVVVRGSISESELGALREETAAQIAAGPERSPRSDFVVKARPDGRHVFFRIQFLTDKALHNESMLHAMVHPDIVERTVRLLGPDWTTYGSAMVFKPEGGGPAIDLHRDVIDLDRSFHPDHIFFNADVYLDAASPDTGCLRVIPGSHRRMDVRADIARNLDHPDLIDVAMAPGDVLLHHSLLLHASAPTPSGSPLRRVLYYSFQSADWMLREGVLPGLVPPRRWIASNMRLVAHATERRAAADLDRRRARFYSVPPEWQAEVAEAPLDLRPVAGNLPWETARETAPTTR